ncbi:MAG: ctpA [Parcubacteria group bacterium]|nr:ctpA [Parcubacteria group bacterium]
MNPEAHSILNIAFIISLFVVFFLGYHFGAGKIPQTAPNLINTTDGQPASVDFSAFWKAWNILNTKFVATATSTKAATEQDKVYGAIQGLTSSFGDPYTVFFPPKEASAFADDIRGNFQGVGMEVVSKDGTLTVIAPLKGSPAERSGVLPGDIIVKIGDKDTTNMSTEEAVALIRGEKGTPVTFTVVRSGRKLPFDITVMRDVINIPTTNTKDLGNGIFKIDLYSFTAESPELFRQALRQFVESGDTKLILDLRGNPGGYLEAAIDMASWFLPSGKVIVRESYGDGKEETVYRSKGYNVFKDNLKFVILVDGGSASAAEILAGALEEQGKATLVGQKTFGKGSVQELIDLTPTTSLKVTVARWLTPNGLSISKQGIVPEYIVERTEADFTSGKDPQLNKAIEVLNKK